MLLKIRIIYPDPPESGWPRVALVKTKPCPLSLRSHRGVILQEEGLGRQENSCPVSLPSKQVSPFPAQQGELMADHSKKGSLSPEQSPLCCPLFSRSCLAFMWPSSSTSVGHKFLHLHPEVPRPVCVHSAADTGVHSVHVPLTVGGLSGLMSSDEAFPLIR